MKKSRKQMTAAYLILLSALTMMQSCGDGSSDVQTSVPKTEESSTIAEEQVYTDQYKGIDYGGETYTLAVFSSPGDFPNYAGEESSGEPINDAQFERDSWIKEQFNVELKYATYMDDNEMVTDVQNQILASDTTFDCLQASLVGNLCTLASGGMLADLYQIEELDLTAEWWSQNFNETYTINSKLYMATGPIVFSYFYSPRLIAYNLQLAGNYDIPDLYAVVNEGKWTLDYMYDLIKDFSADLNGDGKMGEDDLWGASVDEYSAAGFFLSAGGEQMHVDADGKPYFVIQNSENVQIIDKVASIIGNKDLTQKAEKLAVRSGSYDIRDKVYTFKNGNALFLGYGAQAIAFYLRDMTDDYGILPVPKYDETQTEYITVGNSYVPAYVSIPMNNERGSMNGVILNTMGYISRRDVQPLISDVLLKGKAARDEQSQRMIDLIYSDIYLDLNCSYNFGNSFTLLRDITMGNKENFTSQWEKFENNANAALDKLYEEFSALDS